MATSSSDATSLALTGLLSALAILVACALPASRDRDPQEEATSAAAPLGPVIGEGPVLLITGNEHGAIRPCGCSKPVLGGLDRRATAVGAARERLGIVVPVSGGDMIVATGRQQQLKFEAFLMALAAMGYQAFAPGPGEFLLGLEYLREAEALAGFPFVCANVRTGGARPFTDLVALEGLPWSVTGLTPPMPEVPSVEVADPAQILSATLASLAPDARLLVLWSGTEDGARSLARSVPEASRARVVVAFGGPYGTPALLPDEGGVTVLTYAGKGQYLALVRLPPKPIVESIKLPESLPADELAAAILQGYRDAVRGENLLANVPRVPGPAKYVGDDACIECHEVSNTLLAPSAHKHAFASLQRTGDDADPECVKCHVTGWAVQGAFESFESTPELVNVNCEACHGPSGRHADLLEPTPGGHLGAPFCLVCHDPDNSPAFDFERYWPKIAHPPIEEEEGG